MGGGPRRGGAPPAVSCCDVLMRRSSVGGTSLWPSTSAVPPAVITTSPGELALGAVVAGEQPVRSRARAAVARVRRMGDSLGDVQREDRFDGGPVGPAGQAGGDDGNLSALGVGWEAGGGVAQLGGLVLVGRS